MITDEQIQLVQSSFVKISLDAITFSTNFYHNLFALAPEVRPLFKEDIQEQGDKLIKMLGMIINNLYDLDTISHQITSLGKRHVNYGVKDEDYTQVGQALIAAIEEQLGDSCSKDILDSWRIVYQCLAEQMTQAANDAQ